MCFRIQIDYSSLSDHLKDLEEKDEIKKVADKLLNSIKHLQDTLTKIQAPNMKVRKYLIFLANVFICTPKISFFLFFSFV